jgi:hypothetical protein
MMLEAFEILFSGATRMVTAPLNPAEQGLLQRSLAADETLERYLRGRGERVGWTLWALTAKRLHCITINGKLPPRAYAHGSLVGLEAVRGKWGATVLVRTAEARELIFAADFAQSDEFLEALADYNGADVVAPPKLTPPPPPPEPVVPRRAAVSPAPGMGASAAPRVDGEPERLVESLREAAALREKGLLTDDEFAALKRRLLGT